MKVLITGVNGFIGEKLAAVLLKNGYEVLGADIAPRPINKDIEYVQADITDKDKIMSIFLDHSISHVVHLAALVHKSGEDLSKDQYNKINAQGSENVFSCAAQAGVGTMLFASTIEVYGEQQAQCIDEETPCNPSSYYAVSKHAAERALLERSGGFQRYAVMRFAPVYAPEFRLNLDKRFYMLGKRYAFFFKDGSYSFHFCEVGNIIDFVRAFLEGKGESGIYNISDKKSIVAKEFIKREKEHNGLKLVLHLPYRLCYAAIAALECLNRLFSKSEPFFSRYNFRKLFKSTVYNSEKARENVAPMRLGIEALYE